LRENTTMSAQFIHSNNQSLLWKLINNTPQTINYFVNAPPGEKERWFQSVIGHVYNQYNGQNISLRDMNKRAIDSMLQSLQVEQVHVQQTQSYQSVAQPQVPYQSGHTAQPYPSAHTAPYQTVKSREQQLTDQFTRRQAEYETMVKKDVPTPHFTENVKDEAILDLGSAVKEYMKQRDQDIEIPKPLTPSVPSTTALQSLRLDLKNAEPISLAVEELPSPSAMPSLSAMPLKKVQWGENTEHVFDKNDSIIIARLEKDIAEMKLKLDEILALLQK
jgi:hypothetical protein